VPAEKKEVRKEDPTNRETRILRLNFVVSFFVLVLVIFFFLFGAREFFLPVWSLRATWSILCISLHIGAKQFSGGSGREVKTPRMPVWIHPTVNTFEPFLQSSRFPTLFQFNSFWVLLKALALLGGRVKYSEKGTRTLFDCVVKFLEHFHCEVPLSARRICNDRDFLEEKYPCI